MIRWGALGLIACIPVGIAVSGCSAGSTSTSAAPPTIHLVPSPLDSVQVAESWLAAISAKNLPEAASYLKHRGDMDWDEGITADWPTFADVQCKPQSTEATSTAEALCTFNETGPPDTQLDGFWTVSMSRQSDGRWLITNWGTG